MTFVRDVRQFLNRESKWSVLFLFLLTFYAVSLYWPGEKVKGPEAQVLQELRQAENLLKNEIQNAGGLQKYLAGHPRLLAAVNVFSLVLLTLLIYGIFIDLKWLFRRDWREGIRLGTGPPEALHWGLGTVFKVALLFITMAFGMGFLLSLVKHHLLKEASGNFFALVHTTISDFMVIALVVYFISRRGGNWRELGFKKAPFCEDLKIGLAGYAGILPIFVLILIAVALGAYVFTYEPPPHPLVEIFLEEEKRSPLLILYSLFLACVAGPVLEEIFFRGFCYPALKKRWGTGWGLVLSASFFALIHASLFAFLPIFVLGFGLAYLYEKRGSLVPSITLHVVHNVVFITYFFLAKSLITSNP